MICMNENCKRNGLFLGSDYLSKQKKRILYIVLSYTNFQKDPINELADQFSDITVLVRTNPIAEIANYISIPYLNRFTIAASIDKRNIPENVIVLPTPVLFAPTDSQYKKLGERHFKVVEQIIEENNIKFDIVHSHFLWSAGYVGAKLKEKYGVPFVATAHGFDIYILPFKDKVWKESIRYVLNAADHVITVSKSNYECIKKLDVVAPISIIPNGFKSEMFRPEEKENCRKLLGLPLDKKLIVSAGYLAEEKGHTYLVEAMSDIVKQRDDVLCYIVGTGALEHKLKKRVASLGLKDKVKFVGFKPHDEMPAWMNACDVFVLPSLTESFGVVQIEAMACGKPVVATYNGGSEELILSDEHGFLVEPKNSHALSEAILLALDKQWDAKAIMKYAERFQWEKVAEKIRDVYNGLGV